MGRWRASGDDTAHHDQTGSGKDRPQSSPIEARCGEHRLILPTRAHAATRQSRRDQGHDRRTERLKMVPDAVPVRAARDSALSDSVIRLLPGQCRLQNIAAGCGPDIQ